MKRTMSWVGVGFGAAVFAAGLYLRGRVTPLMMGTCAEAPPFAMAGAGPGAGVVGFDVELARAIAEKAGRPLRVVNLPFEDLIPALDRGEVEMAMGALMVTEAREGRVDFSAPYYEATPMVLLREGEGAPAAKEELSGRAVGAVAGGECHALAREVAGAERARPAATPKAAVGDLLGRQVDFVLMEGTAAMAFQKRIPGLRVARLPFPEAFYAVAVRSGNAGLREKVDRALEELAAEGRIDSLVDRWMVLPD